MARRRAIHIGRADRFIADTHFGHGLMTAVRKDDAGNPLPPFRPFDDIDAHDDRLIQSWNRMVGRTDTVYHLGDFAGPRTPEDRQREIFDRLKGCKILLPGNHDDETTRSLPWDNIIEGPQHFRDGMGQVVIAMHWPIYEWDGFHSGALHIHGHTHGNRPSSRRRFDVGVDNGGSYPQTWSEIKARMDNLPELDIDGVLLEPWKPDRGYVGP